MRGAAASLEAARRFGVEGVAWFGDRASLEAALAEGCPGMTLTVHDAGARWSDMVEAALAADAGTAVAWTGVHELARELRVRLAMARADTGALLVVLRPTVATPGLWGIEPAPRRRSPPKDRLAELLADEPTALMRARRLVIDGHFAEDALVARLEGAEDPGAEVARAAYEVGAIELEAVVQARVGADALRALWGLPEVAARRADIARQIGWAITHTLPRRRFLVEPMGRHVEPPDASLWLATLEGAEEWAGNPRWPLIFRHPRLLVGLVRAAERSPRGTLWWRLAGKAPELPFAAPVLGWARRYAAVDPAGGEALLGARYQQAVARAAGRGDFDRLTHLTAAWQRDLPEGWGGVKASLLAAIGGDDARVLALRPEVEGARSHAIEAELFRLRGLVLRRAGYAAEAEVDLRAALSLELQWARARDLAPWASLVTPHDAGQETTVGAVVTRVALATVLKERGAIAEAHALLAPVRDRERPDVWAALAALAAAEGDWGVAVERYEHAVELAAGDPAVEGRIRAKLALLLRRLGAHTHAAEEARLAWAACLVGAPVPRRLAVGLVVADMLEPQARAALEEQVVSIIDRLPHGLPERAAWIARLRAQGRDVV